MRKMKKLVILVLACLCVMACALGFASCEDETSNQSVGLSFVINEDGESYSVRGIGVCEERDIVIPATYKNKPVTGIESYCFERITSIKSVTIPESVTTIGEGAFYYCNSLTNVVIPDSVTTIGLSTFFNCSKLASVTIGKGVTSIGDSAFRSCYSLTSITIPDNVTSIGREAFYFCGSLTSVTIGAGVNSIGAIAFGECKVIEVYNRSSLNITVGSNDNGRVAFYAKNVYTTISGESKILTDKNGYTLYKDGALISLIGYVGSEKELILPDNITEINQFAFCFSSKITSVTISNSVISIGDYAFASCDKLTSITFTGTYEQWETIKKGSYWNDGVPAEKVVCLGGVAI